MNRQTLEETLNSLGISTFHTIAHYSGSMGSQLKIFFSTTSPARDFCLTIEDDNLYLSHFASGVYYHLDMTKPCPEEKSSVQQVNEASVIEDEEPKKEEKEDVNA